MRRFFFPAAALLAAFLASPALAGPPIICHAAHIGSAKSLPWSDAPGWNGMVDSYDVTHLVSDTLALLTPQTPTGVRMETLRRAAIYASRDAQAGDQLSARLLARALDDAAAGRQDPAAWFDAGYFVEALREMGDIYPALREPQSIDGSAWIRKAIALGGKDMLAAASIVDAGRKDQR